MKARRTFRPDNPFLFLAYACVAGLCFILFMTGAFDLQALLMSTLLVAAVGGFNVFLWRLCIDDHNIEGPSRFGPSTRVRIPRDAAEVHWNVRVRGRKYLVIRYSGTAHEIRVLQLNFSARTLEELQGLFSRRTGRGSTKRECQ